MSVSTSMRTIFSVAEVESFALLLRSPFPEKTRAFYASLFKKINEQSTTTFLKIEPQEQPGFDLEWVGQYPENILQTYHLKSDPDGRRVYISKEIQNEENAYLPLPKQAVVLLRSQKISETYPFYAISPWEKEKHGDGPTHYSSKWGDTIIEIYPRRKKYTTLCEIVCPVQDLAETVKTLRERHFNFVQETATSALLEDPDQRLVQLLQYSTHE